MVRLWLAVMLLMLGVGVCAPAYAGSLVIGKTFLEVAPPDDQTAVSVDGQPFSSERVISLNIQEGEHTLLVKVPKDIKLFYSQCSGGFIEAGRGPALIKVSFETKGQCVVNLVFTTPGMTYGIKIIE